MPGTAGGEREKRIGAWSDGVAGAMYRRAGGRLWGARRQARGPFRCCNARAQGKGESVVTGGATQRGSMISAALSMNLLRPADEAEAPPLARSAPATVTSTAL